MIWGVSFALHEQAVMDHRSGRTLNANLAEYHIPVNADVPSLKALMIDEHDPHVNAPGIKGVGEIGITGSAGAVANAVWHATTIRVRRFSNQDRGSRDVWLTLNIENRISWRRQARRSFQPSVRFRELSDEDIEIEANTLAHPDDMKAAIACVELCREIGNSAPFLLANRAARSRACRPRPLRRQVGPERRRQI